MQPYAESTRTLPDVPHVRHINAAAPFGWLAAGWRDFRQVPWAGSFYGLMFALAGWAMTALTWQEPLLIMSFVTGFLLAAPFLSLGIYDLSRRLEHNQPARLWSTLRAWQNNSRNLGWLAVLLALVMVAWIRLVALLAAIYVVNTGSSIGLLADQLFTSSQGLGFLALFIVVGGALAALVYVASVVTWPMLLDRPVGILTAVATSVKAVSRNPLPMALWAAIIVVMIGVGIITLGVGLIVIAPVIGHATWHAYRELVAND
jgi:uncharacterized membrane protein